MEIKSKKKQTGHSITTYRVRLYDRHFDWLKQTKLLYDQVMKHFFDVLRKEPGLLELSDFLLLRELEVICIGTKEMKNRCQEPDYPLLIDPKVPLYFRRSAINTAIDLARKNAESISPNMTLYKGMYRDFTDSYIELKLFNGNAWVWVTYPFSGRALPKEADWLSPMLEFSKKDVWMSVPVSFEVDDVRTIKERMETEERICAVSVPDNGVMAVAVILDRTGREIDNCYIHGGKEKEEQRRKVLTRIRISEESRKQHGGNENATLYAKLKDINHYYSHYVSKKIVDYCVEQDIKVIVVPNYETAIDFRDKQFLRTDSYRWLGRSILKKLEYKAFQRGIVVTAIRPYHISDCCSECGAKIRKYNEGHEPSEKYYGGKLYLCPNGHQGNTALNIAKNVGKSFLSYYPRQ